MVQMSTTLDNNEVSRFSGKSGDRVEGVTEEVIVSESRILISRLKFKQASEDDESEGGDVHTGPSVMVFENDATNVLFTESVPAGTYDRVKLEKHKFSSEEAEEYADDPVLGEFASPDRLTIIIDGIYKTSTEQPFTIKDDATENIWVDFPDDLVVDDGSEAEIEIVFDAEQVFKDGDQVLNPFDDQDRKQIFKNLQKAFRLQNRQD